MSVRNFCILDRGQKSKAQKAGFLNYFLIKRVHSLGNTVQNDTAQCVFRKAPKSFQHRGKGERLALRADNEQRRRAGCTREVRRRGGVARAGNAVVEAHHALDDAQTVLRNVMHQLASDFNFINEK